MTAIGMYAKIKTKTNIQREEKISFKAGTRSINNLWNIRTKFPNDRAFSRAVKSHGYQVAWNDHSTVINWGHNVEEWIDNLEYYISNYKSKPWIGINGFKQLLLENGYELIEDEKGKFNIIKHNISI